ncbi:anti-sigma factor family protein [Streptomyces sp.]|uniref:anti-sigma factor family protein n=1 Tax=Streptomyces sp. TaxID=1931 RepID=UPI002F41A06C
MTSTTGTDPHPEVAELSALSEGILPPDRSADVRAHVAHCALCSDVLDSLEEIRGLLGTLPGPQRMPEEVAGRIDAALAAEALLDATRPRVPRETTPHVPRGTSSAPVGHADGPTGPGHRGPSGGPGRPGRSGSHPVGRDRRRNRGVLAAISAAAALVLSGVLYLTVSGGGGAVNQTSADSGKKAEASATESVAEQVRLLLAEPPGGHTRTPMLHDTTEHTVAGPEPHAATAVPPCVLKATQRSQPPLAAGREAFQGADAYLLVLPHPGDSTLVDAFFVNASCTVSAPGTVLFQGTFPR